ncbi:MAG: LysR family transcriptional regulator [Anaerovoracaceae bacterium]|nr:LysR family transcriptional regulator [Bacillota bacterium]MDY2670860.1 LysR family transcriptional regulator [Anaerovoracaceae bacterium]
MDNRKYEALLTVAETGSITRAAEQMGYTQSGITQMIKSLENELGVTLLTRTNRGVSLTNAARELLPLMRDEQRADERIKQQCAAFSGKTAGRITIGCLSSVSESWMPSVLETLASRYPGIQVSMKEHETPMLLELLADGSLDLAICEITGESTPLEVVKLHTDEIIAIVPQDHELAGRGSVTLQDLSGYPFISYTIGETSLGYPGWPEAIIKRKVRFNIAYSCKDNLTVIKMIDHRLGVSLASDLIMRNYETSAARLHLDPPIYRDIGIVKRPAEKDLPAASAFTSCLMEFIKNEYHI